MAGSFEGLIAAGLATAFGVPLVPSRPDDEEAEDAQAAPPEGTSDVAATGSAPMMVFGPMLALSALEFLFFGDAVVNWVSFRLAGG